MDLELSFQHLSVCIAPQLRICKRSQDFVAIYGFDVDRHKQFAEQVINFSLCE